MVQSVDSVTGAVSEDMSHHIMNMIPTDARKTMQLPSVECRYEVSANVNVADGLANGAGEVIKLLQLPTQSQTASDVVWVLFDDSRVGAQTRALQRMQRRSRCHGQAGNNVLVSTQDQQMANDIVLQHGGCIMHCSSCHMDTEQSQREKPQAEVLSAVSCVTWAAAS